MVDIHTHNLNSESRAKRNKKPLTSKSINALKPKDSGPYRERDYPATGLSVTVLMTGSKKWTFHYTSPVRKNAKGECIRPYWVFASYPALSLSEARKRVIKFRQLVQDGIDPKLQSEQHKSELDKQNSLGTVDDLFLKLYVVDMQKDNKVSYKDVKALYINHIKPHIGLMKANDVDLEVAAEMLATIGEENSPHIEKKARTYCQTAWKLAIGLKGNTRWKKSGLTFGLTSNPFLLISPPKGADTIDVRYLDRSELIYVWNNAGVTAMSEQLALALKLLISTGQRVLEVLQAEWSEFDLEEKEWVMPWQRRKTRNKIKIDHVVPLTDFHIDLLKKIKRFSGRSKYLFPNSSGKNHRSASAFNQAVQRFCQPTGKTDRESMVPFAPKACRKTFKTLGAKHAKISKEMRDKIQGHADSDVSSKHYDHYDYLEEKRAAMQIWCDWLERTVSGSTAQVFQMERLS